MFLLLFLFTLSLFFALLVFGRPVPYVAYFPVMSTFYVHVLFLFLLCVLLCFLVVGDFAFWVFVTLLFVVVVVATPTVSRVSPTCLVRCRRTGCVVVAPM
jgi:hypothetical protein